MSLGGAFFERCTDICSESAELHAPTTYIRSGATTLTASALSLNAAVVLFAICAMPAKPHQKDLMPRVLVAKIASVSF